MIVHLWKRISQATANYHSEGGVVVCAESVERAIQIANENGVVFEDREISPDKSWVVSDTHDEFIAIFPDAGCC